MDRPSLDRAASYVVRSAEWLVLLLLLAGLVPPVFLWRQSLTVVPSFSLLDGSWLVDTSYKAANGVWFGRDVAFTYGPLYQWLASAPARQIGVSTGSILGTAAMLPGMITVFATFVSARLLLPNESPWRRSLLVVLALIFWAPLNIRSSVCILAFLLFLRMTEAVASRRSKVVLIGFLAAILCLASFLISADTGLYSAAALLLCIAATALARSRTPGAPARLVLFLFCAVAGVVVLVLVTNLAMSSPLNFTYWKSSLAIANGYRWFEASAMTKLSKRWMLATLAFGIVVFCVGYWGRKKTGDRWTRRPAFLVAGFCLAFLMMQSGLVRSDAPHILIGLYPMVFLCGGILLAAQSSNWRSALALGIAVAGTVALIWSYRGLLPGKDLWPSRQLPRPLWTCPAGYQEVDRACFRADTAQLLTTVSTYIDQKSKSDDSLAVFPYQNVFGATSRRTVAGGVLQAYLVNGSYLTDLDISGLEMARPPLALYFPDGLYSKVLDGIPSFTRSPGLWFYLLRHYSLDARPVPGVLGLVRDDNRDEQMALIDDEITGSLGTIPVNRRSTTIDLGPVRWPAGGIDFLKLPFRIEYPWWWRSRKPSALSLQMSFADGSQKMIQFAAEPGRDCEIWVYPWEATDLGNFFAADESQWRNGTRPALTRLQLFVTPFDWISVAPRSITVGSVQGVRLGMRHAEEMPPISR